MSAPNGENRREQDRRIERVEDRVSRVEVDVGVLKADVEGLEDEMRQFRPLVLEGAEMRAFAESLHRADGRLREEIAGVRAEVKADREERAAERERRETLDRQIAQAEDARREQEKKEHEEREERARSERRSEMWKFAAVICGAFVTSSGVVLAAVLAAPK